MNEGIFDITLTIPAEFAENMAGVLHPPADLFHPLGRIFTPSLVCFTPLRCFFTPLGEDFTPRGFVSKSVLLGKPT